MTEIAKKEKNEVSVDAFAQHVGLGGTDEIKATDMKFPMVKLLQKLSPQIDPDEEEYIEEAKAGMFLNTNTKELYKGGFFFLPCAFVPMYIEWKKREAGGGIVGTYSHDEGKEIELSGVPDEHDLAYYHQHFGLILDIEERIYSPAIVSLTSTGLSASREFLYKVKAFEKQQKPLFSQVYKFSSVSAENAKGKFSKWSVEHSNQIDIFWGEGWQDMYAEALALAKSASEMSKRVDFSAAREEAHTVTQTHDSNGRQQDRVI